MNDKIISLIRTYVPLLVGGLIAWLGSLSVDVGQDAQVGLTVALTGLITAVYYTVARALEDRFPQVGYLLGIPKAPAYGQPANPADHILEPEAGAGELRSILVIAAGIVVGIFLVALLFS